MNPKFIHHQINTPLRLFCLSSTYTSVSCALFSSSYNINICLGRQVAAPICLVMQSPSDHATWRYITRPLGMPGGANWAALCRDSLGDSPHNRNSIRIVLLQSRAEYDECEIESNGLNRFQADRTLPSLVANTARKSRILLFHSVWIHRSPYLSCLWRRGWKNAPGRDKWLFNW